ncbi:MAG: HPF/RaiA family ribosome-associated protein [Minicystis sp.]
MQIEVRSRDAEMPEEIRAHAAGKLQLALARFGDRIASIKISLADVNGPKGGVDKTCRVLVHGREAWSVVVSEQDADPYALIERAGDRVGQAVRRTIIRRREHEKVALPSRRAA